MKKLLTVLIGAALVVPCAGQLTVTNFANGAVATATTTGACHSVDSAVIQVGTGSCLRSGGATSNSCYLPTGIALDPLSAGICTGLGVNTGFTIEFWFQPSAAGSFAYAFGDSGWVGAAGAFRCFMNGAAGAGNFLLRGPLTQLGTTGAPLTTLVGQFIHFAVVVDGTANTIEWYVNGVLNNTGVANITGAGTNFTCMGYNGSSALGADGNYDDYRVYNWPRSATDIMTDYTDGLAGIDAFSQVQVSSGGCFTLPDEGYYPCDVSQNAHNGTITRNTEPGSSYTRLFSDTSQG